MAPTAFSLRGLCHLTRPLSLIFGPSPKLCAYVFAVCHMDVPHAPRGVQKQIAGLHTALGSLYMDPGGPLSTPPQLLTSSVLKASLFPRHP